MNIGFLRGWREVFTRPLIAVGIAVQFIATARCVSQCFGGVDPLPWLLASSSREQSNDAVRHRPWPAWQARTCISARGGTGGPPARVPPRPIDLSATVTKERVQAIPAANGVLPFLEQIEAIPVTTGRCLKDPCVSNRTVNIALLPLRMMACRPWRPRRASGIREKSRASFAAFGSKWNHRPFTMGS